VTYWPVAVCHDITFELTGGAANIRIGTTTAKAPIHNVLKEQSILLSIDFINLLLDYWIALWSPTDVESFSSDPVYYPNLSDNCEVLMKRGELSAGVKR
jgi:hypothetical protein